MESLTEDVIPPPEADRQSWDVRLQMRGPTSELVIIAPYLSDHLEARQTRADSGATVLLIDRIVESGVTATQDTSRIDASSLVVDHKDGSVEFAGDVHVHGPHLTLETDSLRWERDTDHLTIPRRVEMTVSDGEIVARRLEGTTALAAWKATDLFGSFLIDGPDGAYRVGIEGRTADVEVRPEGIIASFDTVSSNWRTRQLHCLRATYDGIVQRVDFEGTITVHDEGRSLQADRMRLNLRTDRLQASGHVQLSEADRQIEADHLVDEPTGWEATGTPVRLQVEARQLTAPSISFDPQADWLSASGGVTVEEGTTRHLQASHLQLRLADDELEAHQIRLTAEEFSGELTAHWLQSRQAGELVELRGEPRLLRHTEADNEISIQSDTILLDMSSRELEGRGRFELSVSESLQLAAGRGHFDADADSLRLEGQTRMQYRQEGTDQQLDGETVSIDLVDGQAHAVRWPAAVSGRLEDAQQTTWLKAAHGELSLREGQLDSLRLQGTPDVTHRGQQMDRASRFRAEEMILIFAEDGSLRQLEALGAATALSRIIDEDGQIAVNEVKGARLVIDLEGGAVVAVRVLDKIEGRYLPPEQDEEEGGGTP
ncbi:MAG: hypothetical protein HOH74_15545 [Gemmatimonadetes bacterium]|nr:hypothetical protein [Gemmatimonadota bacterium]MBT6146850.1 hypothetical protein [Gemmatimonadota bacterium]